MDSLHIDEEILFCMFEDERNRQNGEPLSNQTLEMQENCNKAINELAGQNPSIEAQLENAVSNLICNANLDGFHEGIRAAMRLVKTLNSL